MKFPKLPISNLFAKIKEDKFLKNMQTMSATISTLVMTMQEMEIDYHLALEHIKELETRLEKLEASRG